jgi:hypothetical protein
MAVIVRVILKNIFQTLLPWREQYHWYLKFHTKSDEITWNTKSEKCVMKTVYLDY